MAKVINIVTRLEETELPLDQAGGRDILNHLMEYKMLSRSSMTFGEHWMMSQLIKMIENNSGVNACEMVLERNAK